MLPCNIVSKWPLEIEGPFCKSISWSLMQGRGILAVVEEDVFDI